ncbi:MAG: biotin--[acetyl-CoA-carboxylase] ligase [Elusimicrobia bacterium]|nr:biotin--[acetyl-CoA-carboxylase] ligase [Elusimicrobiota bacterium]
MTLPGISQCLALPETGSTQEVARYLANRGAPDHTLVWAERQNAGKGRLGRRWESPPGGLYFSLVLRPRFPPSRLADLSLLSAQAAAAALSRLAGVKTEVKPPNDVLVEHKGRAKKICGILAEASGGSRGVDWVVLGVGINVNNKVPALPEAASLKSVTGREWDLEQVLAAFLREFEARYASFGV